MDTRLAPKGRKSHLKITVPSLLGDGALLLQCFENFLEYGLSSEVYNWKGVGDGLSYAIETDGSKKGKVQLDVLVRPVADGIELDTAVTNLDRRIIDRILYNTCFQFKLAPEFHDLKGERTFVRVEDQWSPVLSLPILSGPNQYRRMQNYYVEGHRPDELEHGGFMGGWGFCPIPLSQAFMAKQSSQSDLAIGILWDRAFYARSNMNDSHHCIHSQANLDDIPPGETRKRLGKIFFAPDGLDQLHANAASFFGF